MINLRHISIAILVSIFVTAFVDTSPLSPKIYEEGQRFIWFPDGNGDPHLVDLFEVDDERFNAATDVKFYLHRRNLPQQELIYGNEGVLNSINYDASKPIKVIVHGWNSNQNSGVNTLLTEAFLDNSDVNVLIVDWSRGANGLYTTAVRNVPRVGVFLGSLIDWLIDQGTSLQSFHLLGHSLGGHVVGIAGRSVSRGMLPYITSLDPANPLWGSSSERIRPSDGAYVEVIHTDAGGLGLAEPVGHNDFYPNGGSNQPGCLLKGGIGCSHSRAYEFMADSIDHEGFMSNQCVDYNEIKNGRCSNLSTLHMGASRPKPAVGLFHLRTNRNRPFYQD